MKKIEVKLEYRGKYFHRDERFSSYFVHDRFQLIVEESGDHMYYYYPPG